MKLFILLAAVAVCNAAKLDKTYLPPNAQSSGGSGGILQAPVVGARQGLNPFGANPFGLAGNGAPSYSQSAYEVSSRAERPRAALERNAAILRQDNSNDGERYSYAYETENGIYAEENGVATNGVEAQGGFAYTGDDGQLYSIKYTADQNGFVPQGDHLPTPPPVPEEILRALEQNARDEAAGIYDDGSYSAAKYGDVDARANGYAYPAGSGFSPADAQDSVSVNAAPRAPARYSAPAAAQTQASFGVQKAYLPPLASQRAAGRQSYNPRTGYRY
ncbi:hypothetical protein O3G_MSEX009493 [Manduca sexta]|uniref:Uncharacterized protein n=1 Tax=Manduca sexta TaxID=7130 RepID=A0A921ZEA2_MANSE|nr:hypothetical protein O3G_MSEX009493 [Manduca sexta]KAG6455970.1 hypothetical protein O3G_MSEX009493 [Manduca sexta]